MTTFKDILNDFAKDLLELKADQPEGADIPDEELDLLVEDYIKTITERFLG